MMAVGGVGRASRGLIVCLINPTALYLLPALQPAACDTLPAGKVSRATIGTHHSKRGFTRFMLCAQYLTMLDLAHSPDTATLEAIAAHSARPRFAALILRLLDDIVDARGRAGPFVPNANGIETVRDWLCRQIMPLSQRSRRGGPDAGAAADHRTAAALRSNVSRAVTELVKAGLLNRHYAGYATNHENRGGGRHAVYVLVRRPSRVHQSWTTTV
jgi:hypothetical protein